MKLWKRIALLGGAVLVLTVTLCSALVIGRTRQELLAMTYERVQARQSSLAVSFRNMMEYYAGEGDSPAVQFALAHYCFSRFADAGSALVQADGRAVYAEGQRRPEDELPLAVLPEQGQARFSGTVDGARLLIVGGWVRVRDTEEREYAVYVTEDITPVYERVERLALRIALVSFGCILGGLALIAALVHRTLRPLAELRRSAARIAQGQYGERTSAAGGDEVGELAESFNAMADSVQAHIRELTETAERQRLFISGVTHEFKTPLTAILLNADSLQNVCLDEQAQAEAVERIVGQCAWLERLVQKLLKLITLREGIDRRPCDTAELIERVRESTEENLNRRGVTLAVRGDTEEMELDADLMQSVLVNLIDNAAKASSPGQTVTLTVREDGFTVEDQGEGIPAAELERVREPFYMVDRSRSKQRGGLGLGLALANEIVQAHGGTLDIESAVGEGTAVRVELWQK